MELSESLLNYAELESSAWWPGIVRLSLPAKLVS
eukprot:COSAG06_NODE_50697_length_317_cov_0.444954_1_plen_33_part_01